MSEKEFADLIQVLIEDQVVYSHPNYDIRKTKLDFHITFQKDAPIEKQRPSKVPVHLKDIMDKLMDELTHAGIVI